MNAPMHAPMHIDMHIHTNSPKTITIKGLREGPRTRKGRVRGGGRNMLKVIIYLYENVFM